MGECFGTTNFLLGQAFFQRTNRVVQAALDRSLCDAKGVGHFLFGEFVEVTQQHGLAEAIRQGRQCDGHLPVARRSFDTGVSWECR